MPSENMEHEYLNTFSKTGIGHLHPEHSLILLWFLRRVCPVFAERLAKTVSELRSRSISPQNSKTAEARLQQLGSMISGLMAEDQSQLAYFTQTRLASLQFPIAGVLTPDWHQRAWSSIVERVLKDPLCLVEEGQPLDVRNTRERRDVIVAQEIETLTLFGSSWTSSKLPMPAPEIKRHTPPPPPPLVSTPPHPPPPAQREDPEASRAMFSQISGALQDLSRQINSLAAEKQKMREEFRLMNDKVAKVEEIARHRPVAPPGVEKKTGLEDIDLTAAMVWATEPGMAQNTGETPSNSELDEEEAERDRILPVIGELD